LQKREAELILHLKRIIDKKTREYESIKFEAVRIPYNQFGPGLIHEEFVNLDSMQRPIPSYVERAAIHGVAVVYKNELLQFLEIFLGTLGYFRLRVRELPSYFFIYISNWLEREN
jgi:hypothetical protein